jgi:hypothetical protein
MAQRWMKPDGSNHACLHIPDIDLYLWMKTVGDGGYVNGQVMTYGVDAVLVEDWHWR